MYVCEFKVKACADQHQAIDEAIRTAQFIRNKCLRLWMDVRGTGKAEMSAYCAVLAAKFPFVKTLNSMARQASAERAWAAVSRFYDNCKKGIRPVGHPKFKKDARSVEYKTTGWKLLDPKHIQFTDGKGIGRLKLIGTWDLARVPKELIKRVRLMRRADGYYCQFLLGIEYRPKVPKTGEAIGLDVGLESFYTDSSGHKEPNPCFLRKGEEQLKLLQRRVSRKQKGSSNRCKARQRLARHHLKISRRREEHAKRLARSVILSNDWVFYENLQVRNLIRNHCLAKSIADASWYQFRKWIEYFAWKFGKVAWPVNPAYTSQDCHHCGNRVVKALSTRTHRCKCGTVIDRDENAALNILSRGIEQYRRAAGN
ncbi:RNA-guided endonuclease InsQ/TnpB family protein [Thermostichus vulcanus]